MLMDDLYLKVLVLWYYSLSGCLLCKPYFFQVKYCSIHLCFSKFPTCLIMSYVLFHLLVSVTFSTPLSWPGGSSFPRMRHNELRTMGWTPIHHGSSAKPLRHLGGQPCKDPTATVNLNRGSQQQGAGVIRVFCCTS